MTGMTTKEYRSYSTLMEEFHLLVDEPMKKYTSFKIGGPADLLALPKDEETLTRLLEKAGALEIPVTLFGGGTNLLIGDKGIRGLTILTRGMKTEICMLETNPNGTILRAGAGSRLSRVCRFCLDQGLSGLEFAAGIPGTLGGAIVMNAGTRSGDMGNVVRSIQTLDPKRLYPETLNRNTLHFSYRHLEFSGIILSATLELKKADPREIDAVFQENLRQRKASQPGSMASAGCYFKNPGQGMSAGQLIDESGLKGFRINDAMVSDIHANYILNLGSATCTDILLLQHHIQDVVFQKFNINLEPEVRMEGE